MTRDSILNGDTLSEADARNLMLATAGKTFVVGFTAIALALTMVAPQGDHSIEAQDDPSKIARS
jgi:hypothetical protein